MCQRLGIRQAFSQAYRPQANGRAEVAGKMLQGILRKIAQNELRSFNWVEALPRVIRIHHDTFDPLLGCTPHQLMFGRERNLGGLPTAAKVECRDAAEFFDEMADLDQKVADVINEAHRRMAETVNSRRQSRPPYHIGDWVFVRRPKKVGGTKLETWWRGPFKVLERQGEDSYVIQDSMAGPLAVHADQLKFCVWDELSGEGVPLHYPPVAPQP